MSRYTRHPDAYRILFGQKLGAAIRTQRHEANLTLNQVANAIGVSYSTIDKWEDGVASVPSFALHQLEKLFECNLYDLMPVMTDEEVEAAS